ncbi:MAG TPA: phosphoribosylpyrophosphate synthetase [Holosporales bacterium]|nr:phosphoribosylpyrophosphate synthetase [Holosporales bacterium]
MFKGDVNLFLFTSTTQHLKTNNAIEYMSKRFPDGELFIQIKTCVKGKSVTIIHSSCAPVNDRVMELLILVDALKHSFPSHIHVVMPYFGYGRQDRLIHEGSSLSAKLVGNLIGNSGIDSLSILDLHTPQIAESFPVPVHHYSAIPLFAGVIRKEFNQENTLIVSPDFGGLKRAEELSDMTNVPFMALTKKRKFSGEIESIEVLGDPSKKHCLIVDDIIDSGATLIWAAEALLLKGASSVSAFITHAVLSNPVDLSILNRLWVTDSIFHKTLPEKTTLLHGALRI